jgi:hypothetical protein
MTELVVAAVAPQVLLERLKDYGKRAISLWRSSAPEERHFLVQKTRTLWVALGKIGCWDYVLRVYMSGNP